MESSHILVLGIGNLLNTDEGVGVHAVKQIKEQVGEVNGVAMEDGGTLGLNLLPLVEEATHLLILDALFQNISQLLCCRTDMLRVAIHQV